MADRILLGNEAVAWGALHAGISAAYSYPGTPATEITECIMANAQENGKPVASWSANEKTAYETALGVSLSGKRALVTMKHVGLNVAADPFINSALTSIRGGLVIAVADDPGMHSSQNEQDSRFYADFAKIFCLEPSDQQEAYEMTRLAFDLSEEYHIPVMLRLVTRLSHSRSNVTLDKNPKEPDVRNGSRSTEDWVLLPSISRRLFDNLVTLNQKMIQYAEKSDFNPFSPADNNDELAVITTGIAKNYYFENRMDMPQQPAHLHIGVYPFPIEKIRGVVQKAKKILVLEEGYPFIERYLRGILPPAVSIAGRMDESIPQTGELSPDIVRKALGLSQKKGISSSIDIPLRPPQFCYACPHLDSFSVLQTVLKKYTDTLITSDIGCYTLSALPPLSLSDSTVCMGASIGMAKGAAESGKYPVIAVIGDSTFLHSGVTSLMDAVSANTDMTLLILDNEAVGMTGAQSTILPSQKLKNLILGLGVDKDHLYVLKTVASKKEHNISIIDSEISYHGLSVIIMHRACIVSAKKRRKKV